MKNTCIQIKRPGAARRWAGSLLILLLAMGTVRKAAAVPLAYEGFQYAAGQLLPTMSGGSGWIPGPWIGSSEMFDTPPTLSYPTALPSSGDSLHNPAAGEAWRDFGPPLDNTLSDLWISFQEETALLGSGALVDIMPPLSGPDIQVNKDGGGVIRLNGMVAGLSAGVGNVDFFVLQVRRFSGGITVVRLFLNPGTMLGPPSAWCIIPSVFQANRFFYITDGGQWLDEIRVGTTPQDVAAANETPVPPGELVAPKIGISGDTVTLTVQPSVVGRIYKLEYSGTLADNSWQDPGVVRVGDGNDLVIATPYEPGMLGRMYRLVLDGPPWADPNPEGFEPIPAGSFAMGNALAASGDGYSNELPVHGVYLTAFHMAKNEVTKALWDGVRTWGLTNGYTDLSVGAGKAANHPVQTITWYDMVKWCNARSEMELLTPCYTVSGAVYRTTDSDAVTCNWTTNGYRLPTEAEWEKAARGGLSGRRFPWGNTITHSRANYNSSSTFSYDVSPTRGFHPTYATGANPYTSPVGSFAANGYGLYDMAGNVWEWCWDWDGSYTAAAQINPQGAASGTHRVIRGGSWNIYADTARCAYRAIFGPSGTGNISGFRLARSH